jgi:hypothetical protein
MGSDSTALPAMHVLWEHDKTGSGTYSLEKEPRAEVKERPGRKKKETDSTISRRVILASGFRLSANVALAILL